MQLVTAQNIVEKTNKPVLILTPLAVGHQTVREAQKFGIDAAVSRDGKIEKKIVVTNYERLGYFNRNDFGGVLCDESSRIKSCDSVTRDAITEFMKPIPHRGLYTATAAPNDWHELGTSSEALGELGFRDMITMFFKQETSKDHRGWGRTKYRFREHAKIAYWRWVCSWARACRKPSDLGEFGDAGFVLPPLVENQFIVARRKLRPGFLMPVPARTLEDQREERRATIKERCEKIAELVAHDRTATVWCHLNDEGDRLDKIIPGAVQVSGKDSDDSKERKLLQFADGGCRVLVLKAKIGAWGLNWQHCHDVATFTSNSFEQQYQLIHRHWRFGQLHPVTVNTVATEGEEAVMRNLQRKAVQVDEMFTALCREMRGAKAISKDDIFTVAERLPQWI